MRYGESMLRQYWRWLFLFLFISINQPVRAAADLGIPPQRRLKSHTDGVTSVSFFPDNVRAASGSYDRTIKIWDVTDGRLLRTIAGHGGPVKAVSVSPDGKSVASGSADHTARVWDAKSGDQIAQLEGHTGVVEGVAFLPDGRLLTGGQDGLRLWDVPTEKLLWKSGPEGFGVFRLAVSGNGKRAAYVARDGSSYVWDIAGQKLLAKLGGSRRYHTDIGINFDGSEVYGNDAVSGFTRWEVQTGKALPKPEGMVGVMGMAFFPDQNRTVMYGGLLLSIWDISTQKKICRLKEDFMEMANCVTVSPDGKLVLYATGGMQDGDNWIPGKSNLIDVFSVPAAPGAAPTPGSANLPEVRKPLPPGGVVDHTDDLTIFNCGGGTLHFANGALRAAERTIKYPWEDARAGVAERVKAALMIQSRLISNRAEPEFESVGLTPEQKAQLFKVRRVQPMLDEKRLNGLFSEFSAAGVEGPAYEKLATALLAEARQAGEKEMQADEQYLSKFQALFSQRQWKLLNHEEPGSADSTEIPVLPALQKTLVNGPPPGSEKFKDPVSWGYALGGGAAALFAAALLLRQVRKKRAMDSSSSGTQRGPRTSRR